MTREEAKRRAELYWALGDGKAIQVQNPVTCEWKYLDINQIDGFNEELKYRIKPEPKCRPFKSKEECLEEMQKHHPFGRLKSKNDGRFRFIDKVTWSESYREAIIELSANESLLRGSNSVFEEYTFADGTPFGIKE